MRFEILELFLFLFPFLYLSAALVDLIVRTNERQMIERGVLHDVVDALSGIHIIYFLHVERLRPQSQAHLVQLFIEVQGSACHYHIFLEIV